MAYTGAALVGAASLAAIAWSHARTGEYCTPFSVVVAAWGGTFALFLLRFLPYVPLSARAGAIIALGVGSLLAGILLGPYIDPRPRPKAWPAAGAAPWACVYAVLGIAGTAWYVWLVDRHLGWASILHDAPRVRYALVTYEIPSRFLFLQFFCIAAPLVAIAIALAGERVRWPVWLLVGGAWAGTLLTTDRTQFFIVLLSAVFMWLYRRGPSVPLSRFAWYVGLAGFALVANFLIVGYWVGKSPQAVGTAPWLPADDRPASGSGVEARSLLPQLLAQGSTVYLYATGSYPAFGVYVGEEHPRTYGVQAIYPLARLLERAGILTRGVPPGIPAPSLVVQEAGRTIGFNAYTFLYYPYQDFGAPGVAAYCLIIGMLAGVAYQRTQRMRASPLHLVVLGQISMALALSVFVNKFNNTATWYVFVLTVMPFLLTGLPAAFAGLLRRGAR